MNDSALESNVLALNRLYLAIHVISAKRAFCLLCKGLAEVIDTQDGAFVNYDFSSWQEVSEHRKLNSRGPHDDWVRTVTTEIQVPRIIRLLSYERMPKQTVKFNRRNIFARDHNLCQYCGKRFATSDLSLDHVVPRSQGGGATWENIVCACLSCNIKKGGRTPKQANIKLIRKPEKPKRSPLLSQKLTQEKYQSWKSFLDSAYWSVELR
ncbi:MAG TPA: HNH endonuclease [Gemmatales bacterium]|nr:HNH endonuclease [Gemmatales bacterium]